MRPQHVTMGLGKKYKVVWHVGEVVESCHFLSCDLCEWSHIWFFILSLRLKLKTVKFKKQSKAKIQVVFSVFSVIASRETGGRGGGALIPFFMKNYIKISKKTVFFLKFSPTSNIYKNTSVCPSRNFRLVRILVIPERRVIKRTFETKNEKHYQN